MRVGWRTLNDGDLLARRFDDAGFGDVFHAPSAAEWDVLRRGNLPDLEAPLTRRLALDTLYSLLADADFEHHQREIDRKIAARALA
jgi:transaldolase